MNGLILLDKPAGLTSHDAVFRLRKQTGIPKVGHAGTLDPLATGLLLMLLGQATRLSQFFTGMDKEYHVRLRLGQETDTFDLAGNIIRDKPVDVSEKQLLNVLQGLQGEIEQIPPMYSAVKVDGKRLYKLAREGRVVERRARRVFIYSLVLAPDQDGAALRAKAETEILVRCSSGTYIRSLVHEIGAILGCGALVVELRRTAVGPYLLSDALKLDTASQGALAAGLIPMESLLQEMPGVAISDTELQHICHGRSLTARPNAQQGWVRLLDPRERLVALGMAGAAGIHPKIVLSLSTN